MTPSGGGCDITSTQNRSLHVEPGSQSTYLRKRESVPYGWNVRNSWNIQGMDTETIESPGIARDSMYSPGIRVQ